MEKAKAAISEFMTKAGKHDTTVDETVAPAVTHETVQKTHHENTTAAVDREVHQDHYHTTVQPVQDREVRPEQHSHRVASVEHRQHHHGDEDAIKARLEQERAQFTNTRTEGATQSTHSEAPVVSGEHRHHHVHEVIQPVIHKETIQPSVTHTVIPVHEVHHNAAKHHAASVLPTMSMEEFTSQGGSTTGREARHDRFKGEPGANSSSIANNGSGSTGAHHHGHHENTDTTSTSTGTTGTTGNSSDTKPTLREKLDPRVDSTGDGTAGFMK